MMAHVGGALTEIAAELPLIFPLHPRTRGTLDRLGIDPGPAWPLGRKKLLLVIAAFAAMTGSGNSLPRT